MRVHGNVGQWACNSAACTISPILINGRNVRGIWENLLYIQRLVATTGREYRCTIISSVTEVDYVR